MPFDGEWSVFWGGESIDLNAHYENRAQKHAIDFLITDENGNRHKNDGKQNSDYFCFAKEILAPATGKVVEAVDGIRDNTPGDTNPYFLPGNYILIKHSDNQFSFLAHLKKGSVAVKQGGQVHAGQKIGLCGNSGNSGEPHLHYHMQDSFIYARYYKNYERQEVARGIKTKFENINLNGSPAKIHSPIKDDKVEQL